MGAEIPDPQGTKSEILAEKIFLALVGGLNVKIPQVDLTDNPFRIPWDANSAVYDPVEKVPIEEVISYFHAFMGAFGKHLQEEYDKNRITGTKYADVYLALTQGAMQNAIQYALGKDQAFWTAARMQADAITARAQNEVIKLEAMLRRATYALTKLKLATEDSTFGQSEFQRKNILPAQLTLITEQGEAQRAQTADDRASDGQPIAGLLKVQKDLYRQQIESFKGDMKIKATKIFSDLWTIQRTHDPGTAPSVYFRPLNPDEPEGTIVAIDAIYKEARAMALGEQGDRTGWEDPYPPKNS